MVVSLHHFAPVASAERAPVVLMVEDDTLLRLVTADNLRDAGLSVIEAGNVAEAMDVLQSGLHVDLVFTDIQMPGRRDGFDLTRWVQHNYQHINVLLTSGATRRSDVPEDMLGYDMLSKPYDHDVLMTSLNDLLRRQPQRPPQFGA